MELVARRDVLTALAALATIRAVPGLALAQASSGDRQATTVLDEIASTEIAASPETATYLTRDVGALASLRSQLGDRSPKGEAATVARLRAALAKLDALPLDKMSPNLRITVRVVQATYRQALAGFAFGYGDVAVGSYRNSPYVVVQNVGAFIDVPLFLSNTHPVADTADVDAYLARMSAFPAALDGETERLVTARGKGVVPPDFLLDKAIAALRLTRAGAPETWQIVTQLGERAKAVPGDHVTRAAKIAAGSIGPALDRQIAELTSQRQQATHDAGVWKLPQGDAYYAWALAAGTTTTLSPEEVHRMGLDQFGSLQSQMEAILRPMGYTKGSVAARLAALAKESRYTFPDTDAGRDEILTIMRTRIAAMAKRAPEVFTTSKRVDVDVRRQLIAQEIGGAGAYGGPGTPDGRVPPTVWMNLRTPSKWTRFQLPDLAYHEGIFGHGWQGQYTFDLPAIRNMISISAYREGWALYAEQLADELGAYKDAPLERLGYLQSMAFRAGRLVVDTGLHNKRWTREQAIQWFAENNGEAREDEVDRYCAWPGQACAYKVGHTRIVGARERARKALGDRFDLKAFHGVVLDPGDMPLLVLDEVVDAHIIQRHS